MNSPQGYKRPTSLNLDLEPPGGGYRSRPSSASTPNLVIHGSSHGGPAGDSRLREVRPLHHYVKEEPPCAASAAAALWRTCGLRRSPGCPNLDHLIPNPPNGRRVERPAEETKGHSSESGIMVLKQKTGPRKGAPNRCYHAINPDRIQIAFDDHRLVANAGLTPPSPPWPCTSVFLNWLTAAHLDLGDAPGRANTGDKIMTLVASALAGGDCIDDADALRAGGTVGVLGCVV